MTKREFLNAVIANSTDDVKAFAQNELAALDNRNSSRASSNAKKKAEEYAPIIEALSSYFSANEGVHLTSEIAAENDLSTSKVTAVLRKMVDAGTVGVQDVKVKGKGVQKGYFLIAK